jgi:hypothetical protein
MKVFYQIVLPYVPSSFPLSRHSILADVAAWFPANFEYCAWLSDMISYANKISSFVFSSLKLKLIDQGKRRKNEI